MSIQRYDLIDHQEEYAPAEMIGSSDGDYVLYTDCLADKQAALDAQEKAHQAELHNLLSTLADIRAALGVGDKPMLSELAGIVREIREQADRDEKSACKMQGERDRAVEALKVMLRRHGCVEGCCAKTRAVLAKIEEERDA